MTTLLKIGTKVRFLNKEQLSKRCECRFVSSAFLDKQIFFENKIGVIESLGHDDIFDDQCQCYQVSIGKYLYFLNSIRFYSIKQLRIEIPGKYFKLEEE